MYSARARAAAFVLPAAFAFALAGAYPEGAPWGAAHPQADESCAECHYDYEPEFESQALRLVGLPERAEPGKRYALELRFDDPDAAVSGFQLLTTAGRLESAAADVEARADAARSVAVRRPEEGFVWPLVWVAPAEAGGSVSLFIAASSANDDQSPFGDRIHYRRINIAVGYPTKEK